MKEEREKEKERARKLERESKREPSHFLFLLYGTPETIIFSGLFPARNTTVQYPRYSTYLALAKTCTNSF